LEKVGGGETEGSLDLLCGMVTMEVPVELALDLKEDIREHDI